MCVRDCEGFYECVSGTDTVDEYVPWTDRIDERMCVRDCEGFYECVSGTVRGFTNVCPGL